MAGAEDNERTVEDFSSSLCGHTPALLTSEVGAEKAAPIPREAEGTPKRGGKFELVEASISSMLTGVEGEARGRGRGGGGEGPPRLVVLLVGVVCLELCLLEDRGDGTLFGVLAAERGALAAAAASGLPN